MEKKISVRVLDWRSGQGFLIKQENLEKKWRSAGLPEGLPEDIIWDAAKAVLSKWFIIVACRARGRRRRSPGGLLREVKLVALLAEVK